MYSIISSVTVFVANRVFVTYNLLNAMSIKGTFVSFIAMQGSILLIMAAFFAGIQIINERSGKN